MFIIEGLDSAGRDSRFVQQKIFLLFIINAVSYMHKDNTTKAWIYLRSGSTNFVAFFVQFASRQKSYINYNRSINIIKELGGMIMCICNNLETIDKKFKDIEKKYKHCCLLKYDLTHDKRLTELENMLDNCSTTDILNARAAYNRNFACNEFIAIVIAFISMIISLVSCFSEAFIMRIIVPIFIILTVCYLLFLYSTLSAGSATHGYLSLLESYIEFGTLTGEEKKSEPQNIFGAKEKSQRNC